MVDRHIRGSIFFHHFNNSVFNFTPSTLAIMPLSLIHMVLFSVISCVALLHLITMPVNAASEDYQIVSADIPESAAVVVEAVKNKIVSSPSRNTRICIWNALLDQIEKALFPDDFKKPEAHWCLDHPEEAIGIELLRKAAIVDVSSGAQASLNHLNPPFSQPSAMLSNFVGYKAGKVSCSSVDTILSQILVRHDAMADTEALINGIPSDTLEFESSVNRIYRDMETIVVNHFLLNLAEQHIADHFSPSSGRITELSVGTIQRLIRARIHIRGPMAIAENYDTKNVRIIIADIMERVDANHKSEIDVVLSKWSIPLFIALMQESNGASLILEDDVLAIGASKVGRFSSEHFWSQMMSSPSVRALRHRRQALQNLFQNLIQKELLPLVLSKQHPHLCWIGVLPTLTSYLNREIQNIFVIEAAIANTGNLNVPQLLSFLQSFKSPGYRYLRALEPVFDSEFVNDAQVAFVARITNLRMETDIATEVVVLKDDAMNGTQGKELNAWLLLTYRSKPFQLTSGIIRVYLYDFSSKSYNQAMDEGGVTAAVLYEASKSWTERAMALNNAVLMSDDNMKMFVPSPACWGSLTLGDQSLEFTKDMMELMETAGVLIATTMNNHHRAPGARLDMPISEIIFLRLILGDRYVLSHDDAVVESTALWDEVLKVRKTMPAHTPAAFRAEIFGDDGGDEWSEYSTRLSNDEYGLFPLLRPRASACGKIREHSLNVDIKNSWKQYVALLTETMLSPSQSPAFKWMYIAFWSTIRPGLVEMNETTEEEAYAWFGRIFGNARVSFDDLRAVVSFGVFTDSPENDVCAENIMKVLQEMNDETRAGFVGFATGSPRLPAANAIDGFRILIALTGADVEYLPTSRTCSSQVDISRQQCYTEPQKLSEKLNFVAAEDSRGGFAFA